MIAEKVDAFIEAANKEYGSELATDNVKPKPEDWTGSLNVSGLPDCISINEPGKGHVYVDAETGEIMTKLDRPWIKTLRKALETPSPPPKKEYRMSGTSATPTPKAIVVRSAPMRDIQVAELSLDDIKDYICPAATDQEAFMFLKLCQARNLNPFTNEAYLIKYGAKAQMVVGKEAFMRKAELHPQYAGFKAGVIVKLENGVALQYREGSFVDEGEKIVGGWAEVYRKDRTHPIRAEVSLKDYDSGKDGPWRTHKATMIRKVPLVQAMREAFPSDLSGCYDSSEFRGAVDVESELVEG
ncbi:MAG: phage recombination protein Bet [Candidatus Pacebacteria bacterium]|nr:phage recombination protein Bet [Candidatus Paceibacterota bacterium]